MDLTYHSPIRFDFKPISGSIVTFEFMLRASKHNIKVGIDLNIYYKELYIIGRISLLNSGMQNVYTSREDKVHTLKFKIPEFDNYVRSYVYITMEPIGNIYEKVSIEDMMIIDVNPPLISQVYAHPQASMAVPHLEPKIGVSLTQAVIRPPQAVIQPSQVVIDEQLQAVIQPSQVVIDEQLQLRQESVGKIVFVSTWSVKCGIALYTEDLYNELNKLYPNLFMVNPINGGVLRDNIRGKLTHLQHEFGIMPNPPSIDGKVIMTWHTIPNNIEGTIKRFESKLDIVAHIVPCEGAREYMNTSKDVYTINLGSKLMSNIKKEDARVLLNIENIDMPIGFVFGFQSPNKNYNRLTDAAKNANIHLIISGSLHQCGYRSSTSNNKNVTILDRYITDTEIDLYALASDILLFDYAEQTHYSSSSALHRTVGAGRPVVCVDTPHFNDISGVPKFRNQEELEKCIRYALDNQEYLGKLSLEFAERTSRENMAKRHMEIYRKYINI